MATTFPVHNVIPGRYRYPKDPNPPLPEGVEDWDSSLPSSHFVKTPFHPFVASWHNAFNSHLSVSIRPDDVWTLIAQGFATHVGENSETFRGEFVRHEGKVDVVVELPGYVKGGDENPWAYGVANFVQEARKLLKPGAGDLFTVDFSTSGDVDRAVRDVVLLGCFQNYFKYVGYTLCGIPSVTLEGNPEDWSLIRDKAERLGKYELHWWMENLLPTLEEFVAASKGNIDMGFWRSFYKDPDESGGPKFGGKLLTLFPYLRDKDKLISNTDPTRYVSTLNIPTSVTRVPWVWKYLGTDYNMEFSAGFMAAAQDSATGTMMPVLGNIIREVK